VWLLLCETTDDAALWAAGELQERGLRPFEVLTSADLGPGRRWSHRVASGSVVAEVSVTADRLISSEQVRGVLNRLRAPPAGWVSESVSADDRDYARQELWAFFASWLAAFDGPVLNRPTPHGLSGRVRDPLEWSVLAARSGLDTAPVALDTSGPQDRVDLPTTGPSRIVLVVGSRVVGADVPAPVAENCGRLARLAGAGLLGVSFCRDGDRPWVFCQADLLPDLRDAEIVDALAEALLPGSTS
jgi:hypothetical protein